MRKQIANVITSNRILCSICLLLCPVFSVAFYIMYLFCGITDMVDGIVARKTDTASEFGARLDTVADFVFLTVCLIKLVPILHVPKWLWLWCVVIALIKISNIISGFLNEHKLISLHTKMNKITGALLFLLPLTMHYIELQYSCSIVCVIATFSSIEEGDYISTLRR